MINKKLQLAGVVTAAILSIGSLPAAKSADNTVVEQTTIMTACKLFGVDSNAGLLTAAQRVQIIQKRLDNALIQATDLSPSAVKVSVVNRNPVVSLDNFMIATADGNSATRASMTSMQLADKWASSLRMCISNTADIQRYISMLTGRYPTATVAVEVGGLARRDDIAILNPETLIPLKIITPVSAENSQIGDRVEAAISTDVPLRPFFDSYLPAGTVALGEIVSASRYTNNNYCGKNAITINFYKLRTPNGEEVPIDGHILGRVNEWTMFHARPVSALSSLNGPSHTLAVYPDTVANIIPSKGYIVGAWKGASMDELSVDNYPRMIIDRKNSSVAADTGEPMLMRLSASTAITLAGTRPTTLLSVVGETH